MNEEDAQTAALQEYFDNYAPASSEASFRAGWQAVAEALIGASGGGFEVCYVAVEQFEDAGG